MMDTKRSKLKQFSNSRKRSLELEKKNNSDELIFKPCRKISPRWVLESTTLVELDSKYNKYISEFKQELSDLIGLNDFTTFRCSKIA